MTENSKQFEFKPTLTKKQSIAWDALRRTALWFSKRLLAVFRGQSGVSNLRLFFLWKGV